jgi:N,N-dimethylformamidase
MLLSSMAMMQSSYYTGVVVDAEVGHPIGAANLELFNKEHELLVVIRSDHHGRWSIKADAKISYIEFHADTFCKLRLNLNEFKLSGLNHIRLLENKPVGYLGSLDVYPGEKLELRVHSPVEWRYTLFRHGEQRVSILKDGPFKSITQSLPFGELVADGLDWSVATIIEFPSNLESGLYSITLTDCNGLNFTMPLVVGQKDKLKISLDKFLVVANTNTWQAYNVWGGKSRYRNFFKDPINGGVLPFSVTRFSWGRIKLALFRRLLRLLRLFSGCKAVSGRRLEPKWMNERLSIKRPLPSSWLNVDSVYTSYVDHLAANEWRGLAWLEREGFHYDYCSDRMLHTGEIDLRKYKGVVLLGHAEYWTRVMYDKLYKTIVDQGVPLINLSGNAIYQEVELDSDGSLTPMRGIFEETYTDPSEIIKTYTALDIGGFAPYKIVDSALAHWAVEGVTFKKSEMIFGNKSLISARESMHNGRYNPLAPGILRCDITGEGASGWEIDKVKDLNDSNLQWLAKGMNKGGGGHMAVIDTKQQFVFFASSIAFVSSLLIDSVCSTIIRNIFLRALKRHE